MSTLNAILERALTHTLMWNSVDSSVEKAVLTSGVDQVIKSWLEQPDVQDPVRAMYRLVNVIPTDVLHAQEVTLSEAGRLGPGAAYFLEKTTPNGGWPSLSAYVRHLFDLVMLAVDAVFETMGIANLFEPPENYWQEQNKSYRIMTLTGLFGMIGGALDPLLGEDEAKKWGKLLAASILVLSLIYPYIRPTPSYLIRAQNWTKDISLNKQPLWEAKKEHLDRMGKTLASRKKVMLVGPSGVGKSETAKAFAAAVYRGEYPSLAGKRVFYFNTAEMIDQSGGHATGDLLSLILKKLGPNAENVILVLDEVHVACKQGTQGHLAEKLKTALDPGPRGLPYVISMTTDEEYAKFVTAEQKAFARRFEEIILERPDEAGMVNILTNILLKEAPEILLENGRETLLQLVQIARQALPAEEHTPYQVDPSVQILRECIERLGATQVSEKEQIGMKLQDEIRDLSTRDALAVIHAGDHLTAEDEISLRRTSLADNRIEVEAEGISREIFFQRRRQLLEVKRAMSYIAIQAAEGKASRHDLAAFHLMQKHLIPRMQEDVIRRAHSLGMKTVIDEALIRSVLKAIVPQED